MDELIPWLYLFGISTGAFKGALEALIGPQAKGLSATTITRLTAIWTKEYETWSQRDLTGNEYGPTKRNRLDNTYATISSPGPRSRPAP